MIALHSVGLARVGRPIHNDITVFSVIDERRAHLPKLAAPKHLFLTRILVKNVGKLEELLPVIEVGLSLKLNHVCFIVLDHVQNFSLVAFIL